MKFKKVLAGFTAAALAVSSLSLVSWAATDLTATENTNLVVSADFDDADISLEGIDELKVVATITASATAYSEWGNGTIFAQNKSETTNWEWNEAKFGSSGVDGQSWFTGTIFAAGETKDLETSVKTVDSFVVGYSVNAADCGYTLESIKFYNGDVLIATYEDGELSAPEEEGGSSETDPEEGEPEEKTELNWTYDKSEITLTAVDASGWGDPNNKIAVQANVSVPVENVTTFADLKNTVITLSGIEFVGCEIEDVTADKVSVSIYMNAGTAADEYDVWKVDGAYSNMTNSSITWDLSKVTDVADDVIVHELGYQIGINGSGVAAINELEVGATVKFNVEEGDEPDPVVPDSIPAVVKFYSQGNENGGWDWVDNGDTEYTITSDSDAIDLKWEPIAVSDKVTDADSFGQGGMQIALVEDTELALVGTKLKVEITDIILDGNAIDDVVDEYTIAANYNSTAAEILILLDFINYETIGKNLSAKVKITTVSEENPGSSSSSGETSEPEESKPVIIDNGGNFVTPGGSASDKPADTATAEESKPADASEENKPTDTAKPADDTTDNGDDSSSAPSQNATEVTMDVLVTDSNAGNVNGDSNANNADKNQNTGVVLAFIPAAAAAAGVVISKKRK